MRRTWLGIAVLASVAFASLAQAGDSSAMKIERLRCEYLENPQGIDVVAPGFPGFWQSDERGQKQTAYRVLVASSPELLAKDQGDLWDSGRVDPIRRSTSNTPASRWKRGCSASGKCGRGTRMGSRRRGASRPRGRWACSKPTDWDAKWIACGESGKKPTITPHNGYHSEIAESADAVKWVAVDLGEERKIDAVQLDPARPYDYSPDTPGFLFPVRFKIEVAGKADFSDAKTVVDQTAADVPNPGPEGADLPFRAGRGPIRASDRHAAGPPRGRRTSPLPWPRCRFFPARKTWRRMPR